VVPGVSVDDLKVGDEVELVIDTLYTEGEQEFLVWKWQPVGIGIGASASASATASAGEA
jgi:uncharacterized protein